MQGSMSLLDISTTDYDDTHKCKACKLACKNDTNFAAWRDKLIRDGVAGIQERDKAVHDYANPGKKKPKNPDKIGSPISYMKEHGVFQPLPSTTNPLGLCHFYPTDPAGLSTLAPPKGPTTVDHLNNLLVLAKSRCTGRISLLCLRVALSHHWGYCRNSICAMCLCVFQSSCLKRQRTGTNHGYHVAHSVPTLYRMIRCFLTMLSMPITR